MNEYDLIQLEQDFEDNSFQLGAERFASKLARAQETRRESTVGAGRRLMRDYLGAITEAVRWMCERPGRGRRHAAVPVCREVGYETAAYMALKAVIDGISSKNSVRHIARTISQLILDELRYRRFRAEAPKLFNWRMNNFSTSNYAHMKRSLDATLTYAEIDTSDIDDLMSPRDRLHVGVALVNFVTQVTPLVEVRHLMRHKNQTEVVLVPTPETLDWLKERNGILQEMLPIRMPMVVPPADWAPGVSGGYRFALANRDRLVRTTGSHLPYDEAEMPAVYAALNSVQATPWRINQNIKAVIEGIKNMSGVSFAGVPHFDQLPLPPRPADIGTNEEARRQWKLRARDIHNENHERRVQALTFEKVWGVVRRVENLEAFWFPHNLDFRGRMYPLPNYLHPQGDDLCKGLLTFAESEAKELGEEGAVALAIHGANKMDEDPDTGEKLSRLSLQQRVDWVIKNERNIRESVRSPLTHRWWAGADKPLQFLAFCYEWVGFLDEGRSYKCSLPVSMDGSCNGVQHFSAMLRDPVGAASVNLEPSDMPSDLYSEIAAQVHRQLAEDLDNPLSQAWLKSGMVDRKLCKRPTMTFAYGSKKYGFREQLMADFPLVKTFGDEAYRMAGYMAGQLWKALSTTVKGAFGMMGFLQEAGRIVAKETREELRWTAPTHFPVIQRYYKSRMTGRITTVLAGSTYMPGLYEDDPNTIDVPDQVDAVAPNFVHSLDASALMFTVNCAAGAGVSAISTVHDSYSTVPADWQILNEAARESFVWMYETYDVVNDFVCEMDEALDTHGSTVPLPEAPEKGDFDISRVRESTFFFA